MVVARRGVLPDIVADGETGLVVKDIPEYLAAGLLEMASSAERRRRWGRAARRRMKEKFSVDGQARDLISVYERLLHSPAT
jgi:glycosyltransferase involved in cell wall biosynthesis